MNIYGLFFFSLFICFLFVIVVVLGCVEWDIVYGGYILFFFLFVEIIVMLFEVEILV